ncbi:hypothetical protein [Streptomyces echinatus]|uniref:hypothetical protein n=1 Tax=Streptomyces echinatus TaxID=67293 RepID=UPI003CD0603E
MSATPSSAPTRARERWLLALATAPPTGSRAKHISMAARQGCGRRRLLTASWPAGPARASPTWPPCSDRRRVQSSAAVLFRRGRPGPGTLRSSKSYQAALRPGGRRAELASVVADVIAAQRRQPRATGMVGGVADRGREPDPDHWVRLPTS